MKILFLGDSITDVGRNISNGSLVSIGQGYALMVSGQLGVRYPGRFTFENRGISGNRVVDIYARIKADCWNEKPDVVSVLVGVNDVWHELACNNGVDYERFYRVYRALVTDTMHALPNVKMMLMEPFVLHGTATNESWDVFHREVLLRAEATKRIAEETGVLFVPLQQNLDSACSICPVPYWLGDGVHPTPAGHQLIADAWVEAFETLISGS